jgi:hypothetical protein
MHYYYYFRGIRVSSTVVSVHAWHGNIRTRILRFRFREERVGRGGIFARGWHSRCVPVSAVIWSKKKKKNAIGAVGVVLENDGYSIVGGSYCCFRVTMTFEEEEV